jgi:hypothetical protein
MKVCEVLWLDAWVDTDDISLKKAIKLQPIKRTTVGFLISENERGVVLSTDYFNKKKIKEVSTPMVIPWGMIEEYWEYEDVETV